MTPLLYLTLLLALGPMSTSALAQSGAGAVPGGDPDTLYAQREDLTKARNAAVIWQARVKANPKDFDSTWKASRALYWLGGHDTEAQRKTDLETATELGRTASVLEPTRPEGYFWMAANMGALAESFGMRAGLKYRTPIREALETVLKIDPAYETGSADRALGRWYYKVPGLFGGDRKKSEEHLRQSLTYDQNSTASRFFLAETLIDMGRKPEARTELQKVLDAPLNSEWAPEDKEWKQQARQLLTTLK